MGRRAKAPQLGRVVVLSYEQVEELLFAAAARAVELVRALLTTTELCAYLKIGRRTWRARVRQDSELLALAVPWERDRDPGQRPRLRWPVAAVVLHLRKRGAAIDLLDLPEEKRS